MSAFVDVLGEYVQRVDNDNGPEADNNGGDDDEDDVVIVMPSVSGADRPNGGLEGGGLVQRAGELKRVYAAHLDDSKRRLVEVSRGDVLSSVLDQARNVAYVVMNFPHELSELHMNNLTEAASLWKGIERRCLEHRANAEKQARLSSEAAARLCGSAVGVYDASSGHFFFGGVFLVPGIPLCRDLWQLVLRHLTPSERRKFGRVSKAFSVLSRSLFRRVVFGQSACGQLQTLTMCRSSLLRSGVRNGCVNVLMLSGCREIEINNCTYADSPMPEWFVRRVMVHSIASHVPAGQQIDLRFSGRGSGISYKTLHATMSALVANRTAFDRVRSIIVSSMQSMSVICSAVALYKLGPMDAKGLDRRYSAARSSINQRLGELKVVLDVSMRGVESASDGAVYYSLSMLEAHSDDEVAMYNCRANEYELLRSCMPSFFVKSVRDFDLCQYLAASSINGEAVNAALRVYVDPHGTLDPEQCERIVLPRASFGAELAAEITEACALKQAAGVSSGKVFNSLEQARAVINTVS